MNKKINTILYFTIDKENTYIYLLELNGLKKILC